MLRFVVNASKLARMQGPHLRWASAMPSFATIDPNTLSGKRPGQVYNLEGGQWKLPARCVDIVDPMNGDAFLRVPETSSSELDPFVRNLQSCTKSGLHNPFKNPDRYVLYGDVCARAASAMREESVTDFFARMIQRTSPKSYAQAVGEVKVTRKFLENFGGDQVRFLARSFAVAGDHTGQQSSGHRWPYGPVAIISPFNFPLEIPALQLMGALFMGNKPVLKVDSKVSAVAEQFLRLLHICGMPKQDVDMIHCDGPVMNELLMRAQPVVTQFTGTFCHFVTSGKLMMFIQVAPVLRRSWRLIFEAVFVLKMQALTGRFLVPT